MARRPQAGEIDRDVLQRQPPVDPGRTDVDENEEGEQRRLRLEFPQRLRAYHVCEAAEQLRQPKTQDQAVEGDEVGEAVHAAGYRACQRLRKRNRRA
jgi:hypothetical protein